MSAGVDGPIDVLHVDDDPSILDVTAEALAREDDRFAVSTAESAEAGLEDLGTGTPDCVLSDYRMPETDGLEFLRRVREDHPDLPFVLYTGHGSEEIASEAIKAGVTDYLQKGFDSSQYTVLANRLKNAAAQYRLERQFERTRKRFTTLIEHSAEVIPVLDGNGVIEYVTPSCRRVLGYEPEELVGEIAFEYVHPEDVERTVERFMETMGAPDRSADVEYRFRHGDGSWVHLYGRAINLLDDPHVGGIVSYNRDVTDLRTA